MKIEDLQYKFSYKDTHRFSENIYILAVKDEEFPDKNVIPILYYNNSNGVTQGIDTYDMSKIAATPNSRMDIEPISERFSLYQIVKICYGTIVANDRWYDDSYYPKCKTFHTNIYALNENEIIEIFKGDIDERKSRFKLEESYFNSLLVDIYLNSNQCFFISQVQDKVIGPFKAVEKDIDDYFIIEKSSWKAFGEYKVNDNIFLEFKINQSTRKILNPNFHNKLELLQKINFQSDKELISEFKTEFSNNQENFRREEVDKLFQILQKVSSTSFTTLHVDKMNRIKEVLKNAESAILSDINLIQVIPEVSGIQADLEKLKDEKFNIEKEVKLIKSKKDILEGEKEDILESIRQSKEELKNISAIKQEQLSKQKSDLGLEIKELENKKKKIEEDVKEEKRVKSKDLEDIKSEIKFRTKDRVELENTIQRLKIENHNAQSDAQQQLIELFRHKKHFDFLSGRDISTYTDNIEVEYTDFKIKSELEIEEYEAFRNKVSELLKRNGRTFENHFIDNLLISIHQNTLTIFAGLPGTGKTSLARLLTQILAPKSRIKEVPVSRGWTSQKDLIGFLNPLSNKFHPSPTGVYHLLKQLDYEGKGDLFMDSPFSYIILDEANLSPMEHYWSIFYNLTDSTARKNDLLKVNLGKNEVVEYANNLRFIATINYDQTTEILSPRVIDRANIIQISHKSIAINDITNADVENLHISYKRCKDFFKLLDFGTSRENFGLDDNVEEIYSKVKKVFEELRLYISPRVEISIKRYCNVAQSVMRESSRPIDYCIAQRLLPMINIQSSKSKQPLSKLLDLFKNNKLDISAKILEQIIKCGEEDGIFQDNFNYFLTLSYV